MTVLSHPAPSGTPRFCWLDRWLEPRWRALLTWVAIAAATTLLYGHPVVAWINSSIDSVQNSLFSVYLFPRPGGARMVAGEATFAFLWLWFPPLLLRLGLVRTLVWIAVGVVCVFAPIVLLHVIPWSTFGVRFVVHALTFALPALAIVGRRSRPWVAFFAGASYAACVHGYQDGLWLHTFPWHVPITVGHLIYGAVMLYGTDPLPQKLAEEERE